MDVTQGWDKEEEKGQLGFEAWRSERAARMSAITALLAHELRQPLAAILSNAQAALRALERANPDLSEIREILNDIVQDDNQASAVISTMSQRLRRREAGREEISVAGTIRETLALLHDDLEGAGVRPTFCCEADCAVTADKAQIMSVLINLVANSLEAMRYRPEDQRRLRVSLALAEPGMAQITVSDSGPGIPDSQAGRLFDPFWKSDDQRMGTGLYICRFIVQAHGGNISYRRNQEGGADFSFTLPLSTTADLGGEMSGRSSVEGGPNSPKGMRVLIVDDSEPYRRATWSLLASVLLAELAGEAADGLEAVRKAEELKPDLILLDVSLTGINGIEAASRIRKVAPDSKVLFLSQYDDPDVVRAVLQTGALGYVLKVDSARELLSAVAAVSSGKEYLSAGVRNCARTGIGDD